MNELKRVFYMNKERSSVVFEYTDGEFDKRLPEDIKVIEYLKQGGEIGEKFTKEHHAKVDAKIAKAKAEIFLKDTDWYVLRLMETSKEIPVKILEERKLARIEADTKV